MNVRKTAQDAYKSATTHLGAISVLVILVIVWMLTTTHAMVRLCTYIVSLISTSHCLQQMSMSATQLMEDVHTSVQMRLAAISAPAGLGMISLQTIMGVMVSASQ